jgi:hypothetical protein
MTFVLPFTAWTDDAQTPAVEFALLYQAFLGTADNPNRSRSLEETRSAIKVLDAFASISDHVNVGQPNETRLLNREGGELRLEADAHQLLQRAIDAWVGTVPFAMAKFALDLKQKVDGATSQ